MLATDLPDAPPADAAGLATLGRVTAVDATSRGAVLAVETEAGAAHLRVDALSDTVLRVRLAPPGAAFASHASYALDPAARWSGPSTWSVAETTDTVTMRTGALMLAVDRAAAQLTVTDAYGRVLLADEAGAAFGDGTVAHSVRLAPRDRLLGLGDKALPVNRRGHAVEMWNTDAYRFGRGTDPLYKSIPFVLRLADHDPAADPSGDGMPHEALPTGTPPAAVGLFYDNSFRARFDLGAEDGGRMRWSADGGALDLYVIAADPARGGAPLSVVEQFAALTGRTPMLPRWALGYHQCRYSYETADEVRAVAAAFRQRGIPCDTLYFDIHYMDGYRVFTWDPAAFPDPAGLMRELHADGFTTVAIVDPGVKADDPAYGVHAEGEALDAYVRHADGTVAHGEVWPGRCAFPDFTRADVRAWWGGLHDGLVDTGVDGIWNDMNEPALFTTEHVEGSMAAEESVGTLPLSVRHAFEGRGGTHAEAHNVYGMQMQRATHEGLAALRPGRRPFTITRAAYAGSQRYGTAWTGDNTASWEHLTLAVQQVLSLGVSGLPFTGADVGGFSGEPSGELLARWTQLGVVTPLFRNHSAVDTPRQEPWLFGDEVERVCREAIELRMRLVPYLYTALWQAHTRGLPMLRPLSLVHPDDETIRVTSPLGFYCGDALLAQPVMEEGQTEREVYLPAAPAWYDVSTGERLDGRQTIWTETPLDRLPLFVRGGSVLPLGPVVPHTGVPVTRLELHVYPAPGTHESVLYDDAGDGPADAPHQTTRLTLADDGATISLTSEITGAYASPVTAWDVVVHGLAAAPARVTAGGREVAAAWDVRAARFTVAPGTTVEITR